MLPCARNCAGKKLLQWPVTLADPAAAEPLLFLYPQWYQSAVQQGRAKRHVQRRSFSRHPKARDRVALATVEDEDEQSSLDTGSGGVRASQHQQQISLAPSTSQYADNTSRPPQLPSHPTTRATRPLIRQVMGRSSGERDHEDSLERLARKSQSKSEFYNPATIGGLALAVRLFYMSPAPHRSNEETISVGASFLQWLTGSSEENTWKHWDSSGCVVHVKPTSDLGSSVRQISLYGTQRARETTCTYLKHSQALYEAGTGVESSQALPEDSQDLHPTYHEVGQLPKPESWSLKSFREYVRTITSARKQRGVERVLYPGRHSYNKAVADRLIEIFSDRALRPFWSSAALRMALEFTCDRTDISFAATSIWAEFRQAGMIPDIACYNLEIKRRLRVGNLGGIIHLLSDLERTHIRPDAITWAVFFKFLRNRAEQSKFLALLSRADIRPNSVTKDLIIQSLIETDYRLSDDDKDCVVALKRSMQKTFGDDWLTATIVRLLVDKCASAGAFETVSKILQLASRSGVQLDREALLAVSRAVSKTKHFEETLLLLQLQEFDLEMSVRHSQIAFAFTQAWDQRHINTSRVIWHYAASHGMVTSNMAKRVGRNLGQNLHPALGQQARFESYMARLIVDSSLSDELRSTVSVVLQSSDPKLGIIEALSRWLPAGDQRDQQMQLAHSVVERNVTQWQRAKPMEHSKFIGLIQEAFDLDTTWQKQGNTLDLSVQELAEQAVKIHLEPLTPETTGSTQTTLSTMTEHDTPEPDAGSNAQPTTLKRINPQDGSVDNANDPSGAGTFQNLFHTCSTYPPTPLAAGALPASTPCTSIPLLDLLLQHLGLAWENG